MRASLQFFTVPLSPPPHPFPPLNAKIAGAGLGDKNTIILAISSIIFEDGVAWCVSSSDISSLPVLHRLDTSSSGAICAACAPFLPAGKQHKIAPQTKQNTQR